MAKNTEKDFMFSIGTDMDKESINKTTREINKFFENIVGAEGMKKLKEIFVDIPKDFNKIQTEVKKLNKSFSEIGLEMPTTIARSLDDVEKQIKSKFKNISKIASLKEINEQITKISKIGEGKSADKLLSKERAEIEQEKLVLRSMISSSMRGNTALYAKLGLITPIGKDASGKKNIYDTSQTVNPEEYFNALNKETKRILKSTRKVSEAYEKQIIVINEQIGEQKKNLSIEKSNYKKRIKTGQQIAIIQGKGVLSPTQSIKEGLKDKSLDWLKEEQASIAQQLLSAKVRLQEEKSKETSFPENLKRIQASVRYLELHNKLLVEAINKKQKIQKINKEELKDDETKLQIAKDNLESRERHLDLIKEVKSAEKDSVRAGEISKRLHDEINDNLEEQSGLIKQIKNLNGDEKRVAENKLKILEKEQRFKEQAIRSLRVETSELEKQHKIHRSINEKLHDAIRNAFTIEKIFNRMAFVLTAKISYEAFDFFNRSLREGVMNAIEMEAQLKRIYSISRDQSQLALKQSVQKSIGFGFNTSDVLGSAYQSVSALYTPSETAKLLDVSRKMAVAGFTTQEEALNALVSVLRSYNLSVSEATLVADKYFKTIELGRVELKDLSTDLGKLLPTASLLGVSFAEVSTAIAVMTKRGVQSNIATTSMNQLLLNMLNPTDEAREVLDKYNITLDMASVKAKGFAKVVKELSVLKDSEIEKIASSKQGFRALAVAIQDNTEWLETYNKIVNSANSTERAYGEQLETTKIKFQQLKGSFIQAGIEVGNILSKADGVLTFLTDISKGINTTSLSLIAVSTAIVTMVIPAINALSVAMKKSIIISSGWQNAIGIGLTLITGTVLTIMGNARRKAEEELERMKSANEKISAFASQERGRIELTMRQIETYKVLSTKQNLDLREKKLLADVTEELGNKYKNTNINIQTMTEKLKELSKQQGKLFEQEKLALLSSTRPEAQKAQKELTKFGQETKTSRLSKYVSGKDLSGLSAEQVFEVQLARAISGGFEMTDMTGESAKQVYEKLGGVLQNRRNNEARFEKEINDVLKGVGVAGISQEGSIERLKFLQDRLEEYRKKTEPLVQNINVIMDRALLIMSKPVKQKALETSGTDELSTGTEEKNVFQIALAKYKQGEISLDELESERKKYINNLKSTTKNELERQEIEEETFNTVFNVGRIEERKRLDSLLRSIQDSTTYEEYDKYFDMINTEYEKIITNLKNVSGGKFQDEINALIGEQASFTGKQLEKYNIERFKAIRKNAQNLLNIKSDLEKLGITKDFDKLSMVEIENILAKEEATFQSMDLLKKRIEMLKNERENIAEQARLEYSQKSLIERSMMEGISGLSREDFIKSIEARKIKENSVLTPMDKESELSKIDLKSEVNLFNELTESVKTLDQVFSTYYNNRLAKIEEVKNAELKAIDETSQFQFRSSLWVESQKKKTEEKAEIERKKLAKKKKLFDIAEATSSFALGSTQIWSKALGNFLFGGIPIAGFLQALLLGKYMSNLYTIQSQKYEYGGIVDGPRHAHGGVNANLEGGEMVWRRQAVRGNENYLEWMNKYLSNGGKPIMPMVANGQSNVSVSKTNESKISLDISSLSEKLDNVVESIGKINMVVELKGDVLSDVKLAKRVDNGNKQRTVV